MNGPLANTGVIIEPAITTVQNSLQLSMVFVRLSLYSIAFCSRPGQIVEKVSIGVCVQFGGSMSNRSRDIRIAHLAMDNDDDTSVRIHNIRPKRIWPKIQLLELTPESDSPL